MVVDVRQNPGGLLSSVEEVADVFLSGGPVVSTRSERLPSENTVFEAKANPSDIPAGIPVAVLVDKGSASASEILAGALKDTGRAKLFGVTIQARDSTLTIDGEEEDVLALEKILVDGWYEDLRKPTEEDLVGTGHHGKTA
jgi:C-terminal processing protease CtpA/Prc